MDNMTLLALTCAAKIASGEDELDVIAELLEVVCYQDSVVTGMIDQINYLKQESKMFQDLTSTLMKEQHKAKMNSQYPTMSVDAELLAARCENCMCAGCKKECTPECAKMVGRCPECVDLVMDCDGDCDTCPDSDTCLDEE